MFSSLRSRCTTPFCKRAETEHENVQAGSQAEKQLVWAFFFFFLNLAMTQSPDWCQQVRRHVESGKSEAKKKHFQLLLEERFVEGLSVSIDTELAVIHRKRQGLNRYVWPPRKSSDAKKLRDSILSLISSSLVHFCEGNDPCLHNVFSAHSQSLYASLLL